MQVWMDKFLVLEAARANSATIVLFLVLAREILGKSYSKSHFPDTRNAVEKIAVAHSIFLVSLYEFALYFVLSYNIFESHSCKF